MPRVAVSLGTSMGDRARTIRAAWACLARLPHTRPVSASRVYETPPFGGVARAPFLNAVVTLDTELEPEPLRALLQRTEARLGRRPARRWADRVLDLDLLLFGDLRVDEPRLVVPHPRLAERPSLLAMLYEAWPDAPDPATGLPWRVALPVLPLRHPALVLPRAPVARPRSPH